MRMKSPSLVDGDTDKTSDLEQKVLSRRSEKAAESSVATLYEFLMMKLGYSESLARAASGYVPPLD